MKKIKNSIVASKKSKIENSNINKTEFHKPSFWSGFAAGFFSSLLASLVFYFLIN